MVLSISIILYIIVAVIVYFREFKEEEKFPLWEKIGLSVGWILLLPLWIIHKIHNL